MAFDDIEISKSLKSALSSAICSGHFPHASILEDEDLERAFKTAQEVARTLICTGKDKPCGKCSACIKALNDSHPDIKVFRCTGSPKTFGVDLVRQIRSDAYIVPNEADKKIYILETDRNMTSAAQNALLKVLEEPPKNVCFILLTPERNTFLQTVLSRCVIFSQVGARKTSEEVKNAAIKLANALTKPNEYSLLEATSEFEKNKELLKETLIEIKEIFRASILIKVGGKYSGEYLDEGRALSLNFTAPALLKLIECVDETLLSIERNENYNLLLTRLCAEMRRASGR